MGFLFNKTATKTSSSGPLKDSPQDIQQQLSQLKIKNPQIIKLTTETSQQNLTQQKDFYLKQLELSPTHTDLLINLALINFYQENFEEAQQYLQKAHYQNPNKQFFKNNPEIFNIL